MVMLRFCAQSLRLFSLQTHPLLHTGVVFNQKPLVKNTNGKVRIVSYKSSICISKSIFLDVKLSF